MDYYGFYNCLSSNLTAQYIQGGLIIMLWMTKVIPRIGYIDIYRNNSIQQNSNKKIPHARDFFVGILLNFYYLN